MPWKASDAASYDKDADTPKKRRQWAHVANAMLKKLQTKGVSKKDAEVRAIKAASSTVESLERRPLGLASEDYGFSKTSTGGSGGGSSGGSTGAGRGCVGPSCKHDWTRLARRPKKGERPENVERECVNCKAPLPPNSPKSAFEDYNQKLQRKPLHTINIADNAGAKRSVANIDDPYGLPYWEKAGDVKDEGLGRSTLNLAEVSPPGWAGSVKAMKKHKDIDNPYALAWWMKKKGDKPHYKDQPTSLKGKPEKKEKYKDESLNRRSLCLIGEENGGGASGGGGAGGNGGGNGGGDAGGGNGGSPPSYVSDAMDKAGDNGHDMRTPVRILGGSGGYPFWRSDCKKCGGKMVCRAAGSLWPKGKCPGKKKKKK